MYYFICLLIQKTKAKKSRGKLQIYNLGEAWERIAVDITGPFPKSASGNGYLLVIVDYLGFEVPRYLRLSLARKES